MRVVAREKNLKWFMVNGYDIFAQDKSNADVENLKNLYPVYGDRFIASDLIQIPFADHYFDHIISSAVLHFAESMAHFDQLFKEHIRVLKKGGTFFIRMCSNIGIEDTIVTMGEGVCQIPDGTTRYLITRQKIQKLIDVYSSQYAGTSKNDECK